MLYAVPPSPGGSEKLTFFSFRFAQKAQLAVMSGKSNYKTPDNIMWWRICKCNVPNKGWNQWKVDQLHL